jgi:flagellar basal body-associated protein FliL
MKPKTTLILLVVFAVLLAAVLLFESRSKARKETEEKGEKLVDLASADVEKITLKNEDATITFKKDDKGEWMIIEPLEAKADSSEVSRLAEDFSSLKFERVIEAEGGDPAKYEIPKKELTLWYKGQAQPVKLLIGMENPLDNTLFAKREDDKRIVLLAGLLKSNLEKKTFDFRQKDIFKFEPEDVGSITLKAKDIYWQAQKKEAEWFLARPVKALAKKSRVEDVLRALSNLRAKEFVAEQKQDAEIAKFGLKDPEYAVALSLPAKNQEIIFSLHKQDETVYATTSISTKIVTAEGQVLADIEKKLEDLREKQVVVFNSWEASKVRIKKGELSLTVGKDKDNKWLFEGAAQDEADGSRVETFIRKIESLEAVEFIDSPADLEANGLAQPQAEVTVWTKDGETEKEFQILVGTEDPEKKQVVLKNPNLDYLFRVDAAFLGEFPKEAKDWKSEAPEDKKEVKQ